MKVITKSVEQHPLLVEGEEGYDAKRRLLNTKKRKQPIGSYNQIEECSETELLEEFGNRADMLDAARRQLNTDRRNAIAIDYLNDGKKAAKEATLNELMAIVADPQASEEAKKLAQGKIVRMIMKTRG